ncbi:MAG: hypothetical protein KC457_03835 [Myxococcales bacterium]|nr:hypothetical protein [Myxococcales bacterium]
MKLGRITLVFSFALAMVAGACAGEKDVSCEVVWSDAGDMELGRATIVYESLDDVDAGLDMCRDDQTDHPDRPADTVKYACNCST